MRPTPYLATSQLTDSRNTDKSTQDTVIQMYKIVNEYVNNQDVQQAVREAIKGLTSKSSSREFISRIFFWIKEHIKFVPDATNIQTYLPEKDPLNSDLLVTPDLLLKLKSGDCDCFSMLASAMLRIVGFTTRFVTVAADKTFPLVFTHIYLEVLDPTFNVWIPFDCSHGNEPDWEYKDITRRYVWTD